MPSTDDDDHEDSSGFVFDESEDADQTFRRMIVASMSGATMKRFAAGAAMAIAGKRGSEMRAPEPIIQAGFEPDEDEMTLLVEIAKAARRDLIHVSCHDDGSGKPTGMVATVYFDDDGKVQAHLRGGLLCAPGSTDVFLAGISDDEDVPWRFVLSPGKKMVRVPDLPIDDLGEAMQRGGELWFERVEALRKEDCAGEIIRIPSVLEGPGGPTPGSPPFASRRI